MLSFPQLAADSVPVRQIGVEVHLRRAEGGGQVDLFLGADLETLIVGDDEDRIPSEVLLPPGGREDDSPFAVDFLQHGAHAIEGWRGQHL